MKAWLGGLLLILGAHAGAADFDYRLTPAWLTADVAVFIGWREDFSTRNGGNIVNTGFIVGDEGVVIIDSGPSRRYGEQMRQAIARATAKAPLLLLNTHQHPDHFLGNQAFAGVKIAALQPTREAIARDGHALAENLYRMSGDWMAGSEPVVPDTLLAAGRSTVAGRAMRFYALPGHTAGDLALYDEASGVLFAGDLVFHDRAPTTPHADLAAWLAALDQLEAVCAEPGFRFLVPGHGQVSHDAGPIRQTRNWLRWLRAQLQKAAEDGLDMNEVLNLPLPAEFADMPLAAQEYRRSVGHLFPAIEQAVLASSRQGGH